MSKMSNFAVILEELGLEPTNENLLHFQHLEQRRTLRGLLNKAFDTSINTAEKLFGKI